MTHLKSVLKNFVPVEPESWFVTGIGNTRLPVRGKVKQSQLLMVLQL
jgi:hypothetical protein